MKLDDGIDKSELEEVKQGMNAYARFGTLGIQMVAFLVIGIFGGRWLDRTVVLKFPLFTLLGTLIGVVGAMWFLFQETKKK